jgi:hypothetical protein
MDLIAAHVQHDRHQGVRVELSQEALLELAAGKTLEFMGVKITATDTAPNLVRRVGWVSHPARTWR